MNWIRRHLGYNYWSLSAYVKKSVKNAVNFIGEFEQAIVRFAREDRVDGVLCGHIHSPVIRDIDGVTYYNSGDWVESCSALVEDFDGTIELVTHADVNPAEPHPIEENDFDLLAGVIEVGAAAE